MDVLESLNSLQAAVVADEVKKAEKNKKPKYHFDKLKMYFGRDTTLHNVKISIPNMKDIIDIGESEFYSCASPFLNNPTSIRVLLYDAFHKDWTKTKDIEVFYILLQTVKNKAPLKLLFKDLDFDNLKLVHGTKNIDGQDTNCFVLVDPKQKLTIYEDDYVEIAEYIREMFHVHPKTEKGKGKATKLWMLQEDRMKAAEEMNKGNENSSTLLSLVSSCVNHPGFKYKLEEIENINFYFFMDAVARIQKYEQSNAALHGIYSGMISAKDLPQDLINYMSEL